MTRDEAIKELDLKQKGELINGNIRQADIYDMAIDAMQKLQKIERIVNAPEYVPQEVQIRYYAICEVLKNDN